MKKLAFIALMMVSAPGWAQQAEIIKLGVLQNIIQKPSDKIQVINFWATWCAPCIKEMPLFEALNGTRHDVQVNLVSMDLDLDPNPEKVHRFVARKKLQSKVYILDEANPNSWIDKIEKDWSGAIPATLVINTTTGARRFVERELKEGELDEMIAAVKN
ncbi:MAG: thioredoxin domain-containing protein [Cyclobacteriaceae bacterium]